MNVVVAGRLNGSVRAIPSKSHVHRLLICSGLGDTPTALECRVISNDIRATADCLSALGAEVKIGGGTISVSPLSTVRAQARLDPGESGSTYRFFTPLVTALGVKTQFALHGKLPSRPMEDLWREMERHGVTLTDKGTDHPVLTGQLTSGEYRLPGSVSSQFFTGLLFALPLLKGDSRIHVTDKLESVGYIEMTLEALRAFGVSVERGTDFFSVRGSQQYKTPSVLAPEGDWSNSAFWLSAGAASGAISVTGLTLPSRQGDSAAAEILRRFGAQIRVCGSTVAAKSAPLHGCTVDVENIPDLVPALAAAAMAAHGRTVFTNAGRLRLKESDRIATVCAAVNALGGRASASADSLIIEGGAPLTGGTVDACGDHRIAMLAAAAAPLCSGSVRIVGASAVNKSYPGFFDDFASLGGTVTIEEA